jgi:hypothetical protein
MTNYQSDIELGERYRDKLTGLEGVADSICFYRNIDERIRLLYLHDGELKDEWLDAADLVHIETQETP